MGGMGQQDQGTNGAAVYRKVYRTASVRSVYPISLWTVYSILLWTAPTIDGHVL